VSTTKITGIIDIRVYRDHEIALNLARSKYHLIRNIISNKKLKANEVATFA
jgi:hypothetical protein